MKSKVTAVLFAAWATAVLSYAADDQTAKIKSAVDAAVRSVMLNYSIPGMAVSLTLAGKDYVFNYGVASRETKKPVTDNTLFELGSISKTFTATLTSYAQVSGNLSLSDKTSKYLPALQGSQFGEVSLLNLGTHTSGGFPLQLPANIRTDDQLMQYLQTWRPKYAPGTYRTYANPSVGMLGLITAKSMGEDFTILMEQTVFPALAMKNTFINVPKARMDDYARGYTEDGAPTRVGAGILSAEAYGIKSTAADMIHYAEANMNSAELDEKFQLAITNTHTAYFQAGVMTQDLIWEQYAYPVELKTLLEGNSPAVILKAVPVTQLTPPTEAHPDVWLNKTGSTGGFGAYVAFIPAKRLGIVILANKDYPIDERVTIAYRVLARLSDGS
jgi:beta-lactamase class C